MFGLEWRVSHQFNLSHLLFQEKKEQTGSYLQSSDSNFKDTQPKICQLNAVTMDCLLRFFPVTVQNSLGVLVQFLKKYKIYDG